ncbi:nuleotide-utilizing enzyme, moea [Halogeometricum pallidum JCM 14848]|uniref:Nuleotide-utilizing enzyme, moea n=1 Tax=Halogeometricum pallidum JCM 14848 TaxID=1227487 RepID=M0D4R5_HALPD|nr:molybdopterin-binding protein [Halogeometricum pallidum]ELZ30440.1 nuleotide-utilizing enzyme, moea [Halogeometricum pallidum JCM 14848]
MDVAIVTVGNELLAGDIENTNATWLARELTERGVEVVRVLTVPDEESVIAETVREWAASFDAVLVTGGLGGTPDDLTMDGVAAGLDRELEVNPVAAADVEATIERILERRPDIDFDLEVPWYASMPAGATPIPNPEGLAPGCVAENVYVLPGIPEEMRAVFANVADDFGGTVATKTFYTPEPEGAMADPLAEVATRFNIRVGSYPNREGTRTRIKLTATDPSVLTEASSWLIENAGRELVEAEDGVESENGEGAESGE